MKTDGRWTKTVKPWPEEIDEWTHWLHAADGNAVARGHGRRTAAAVAVDRQAVLVAAPQHGAQRQRDGVGRRAAVLHRRRSARQHGRLGTRTSGSLVARDAFNGLLLWKKPIPDWGWKAWSAEWTCRFTVPTHLPRRLVAVGDRVYVTLGFNAPLSELDAATGEVVRVLEGTEFTDEILCHEGRLILALNKAPQRPGAMRATGAARPTIRP